MFQQAGTTCEIFRYEYCEDNFWWFLLCAMLHIRLPKHLQCRKHQARSSPDLTSDTRFPHMICKEKIPMHRRSVIFYLCESIQIKIISFCFKKFNVPYRAWAVYESMTKGICCPSTRKVFVLEQTVQSNRNILRRQHQKYHFDKTNSRKKVKRSLIIICDSSILQFPSRGKNSGC